REFQAVDAAAVPVDFDDVLAVFGVENTRCAHRAVSTRGARSAFGPLFTFFTFFTFFAARPWRPGEAGRPGVPGFPRFAGFAFELLEHRRADLFGGVDQVVFRRERATAHREDEGKRG